MKNRKAFAFILIFIAAFSLVGCGGTDTQNKEAESVVGAENTNENTKEAALKD
ncbi:MAG: hypothetical protein ACI4D4_02390 [Lachnospira sp.]